MIPHQLRHLESFTTSPTKPNYLSQVRNSIGNNIAGYAKYPLRAISGSLMNSLVNNLSQDRTDQEKIFEVSRVTGECRNRIT